MDAWEDLDALVLELRDANPEWNESVEELERHLVGMRVVAAEVERHYEELAVPDTLLMLSRRLLGDAARLHSARINFGVVRSAMLIWRPLDDPRQDLRGAPLEGQYSIEVRIGPQYLLGLTGGSDSSQVLSILIAGNKQLVATLPTSGEKLRAALLRVFKDPSYSGPPVDEAKSGPEQAEASAAASEGESAATLVPEGDTNPETAAAPTAETAEATATVAGDTGVPE